MSDPRSSPATGSDAASSDAPAPLPPSARALTARRALLAALLLGVIADPLLRDTPWGVGLLVWMLAFALAAVVVLRQGGRTLPAESGAWLALAVLFAAALSWRDADMLQFFDVLAMLAALGLLAMSVSALPVRGVAAARVRDLIAAAYGTALGVATGVLPLLVRDAELQPALRRSAEGKGKRIGRALLIALPLVIVFTLLLAYADPIFGSFFTLPAIQVDVVVSHVAIPVFFAWVVAGWLRRTLLAHADSVTMPDTVSPFAIGVTDLVLALGALNVLFAAFVLVQIGWLFGGEALVLRTTGLSYAQYARHGFFELMWVAGLLLPVLLGARALIARSDARALRLYHRLAVPLVVLLGAIMVSAGARMKLYVHYYGVSTDRLYASAFMIWLAVVFAWLALTVLRARPRTFAAGLVISAFAVLATLNVLNPDALVARANLARDGAGGAGAATGVGGAGTAMNAGGAGATTGKGSAPTGSDVRYLATLGGDAVPLLVAALTSPSSGSSGAPLADRCAAANTLLKRWMGEQRQREEQHWTEWNAARSRATQVVRTHEAELRQLACPSSAGKPG